MKKIILGAAVCLSLLSAETAYIDKAMDALKEITTEQVDKIEMTANNTESKNEKNLKGFVLSTQIKTFSDIPKNTNQEIEKLKEETQLLIRQVALDIEMSKENKSGALSLDEKGNLYYEANPELADDLNQKRKALLEGDMKNSVSIRSASLAISLLASINNEIIEQAKNARGRKEKQKLYMKQAIYVYEISDIVLNLLDKLTLEGKNSIYGLHKETQNRVNARLEEVEQRKQAAQKLYNKGKMTSGQLDIEIKRLTHTGNANKKSLDVWQGILEKVGSQEEYLEKLKSQRDLIVYKQENAKMQIGTLSDLRSAAAISDSIGSIDDLVGAVDQLDLLVLDEDAVLKLLGE